MMPHATRWELPHEDNAMGLTAHLLAAKLFILDPVLMQTTAVTLKTISHYEVAKQFASTDIWFRAPSSLISLLSLFTPLIHVKSYLTGNTPSP
jgi:hypothetical protein